MKKFLLFLFLILILATGCNEDKPSILFNKKPITKDTVMDYSNVFMPNSRIYYLVLMPKPQKSRFLSIQVIQKDNKEERLGYNLVWSKTVRLQDEHMYYYNDYLVLSRPGAYVMRVYSKDNPTKVYTTAQFFVRD